VQDSRTSRSRAPSVVAAASAATAARAATPGRSGSPASPTTTRRRSKRPGVRAAPAERGASRVRTAPSPRSPPPGSPHPGSGAPRSPRHDQRHPSLQRTTSPACARCSMPRALVRNHWAPYRTTWGALLSPVPAEPAVAGRLAATEFARCPNCSRTTSRRSNGAPAMDFPGRRPPAPTSGCRAAQRPGPSPDRRAAQFKYADAFTGFGALVLGSCTRAGGDRERAGLDASRFLTEQRERVVAAQETMVEDRDQAATEPASRERPFPAPRPSSTRRRRTSRPRW
jgi:hypothetical protein